MQLVSKVALALLSRAHIVQKDSKFELDPLWSFQPRCLSEASARISTWHGLISWTEPGTNPARGAKLGQARML